MPFSVKVPLLRRKGASPTETKILEEKAGQARDIDPLPDRFQGNDCIRMANGRLKLLILRLFCHKLRMSLSLEASPRVPDPPCVAATQSSPRAREG